MHGHPVPHRRLAVATILLVACAGSATAQYPPRQDTISMPSYDRNRTVAGALGAVVPGLGHIYAGEYTKGVELYYSAVLGIVGGYIVHDAGVCGVSFGLFCTRDASPEDRLLGVVMIAVGAGVWVYSGIDAPRAVDRRNRGQHAGIDSAQSPQAQWSLLVSRVGTSHDRLGMGVRIRW
jgi:hypothetical protein